MPERCVVVGTGRAGGSFARALADVGWTVRSLAARPLVDGVATDLDSFDVESADLVLIAVADGAISTVAEALPATSGVVVHVSGACGLDVLVPHRRIGSIHPLMSLPDAEVGAARLVDHCTFAVDGDPLVRDVVASLGGRSVDVPESKRALYHATAAIAANHLTALCAQVERLADDVGVPVDAYWKLMETTFANIADVGAAAALTGPAARGDWETVRAHRAALPHEERLLYTALFAAAAELGGSSPPGDLIT